MKKKSVLFLQVFLFIISAVIILNGIWENNNTEKIVGYILLIIFNLFNIVRGFNRWNDDK